jgi:hypothetical protein
MRLARFRPATTLVLAASVAAATALLLTGLAAGAASPPSDTTFSLYPNPANLNCLKGASGTPTATVGVHRGGLNDTLTINLSHFKPYLNFDLFTIQNSNQQADGTPVPGFTNFGMAWYQSDLHVKSDGTASTKIKTILLDQIFGFDPAVSLAPTNTFHVGFWFNRPKDAAGCGFTGTTPFNGEHTAGPLAFISRPDATTQLGPLCVNPDLSKSPVVCNP